MQIDGNKANQTSGNLRGIDFKYISNSVIKRVYVHDIYGTDWGNSACRAISIYGGSNNWIVENKIEANSRDGINVSYSSYIHIKNNKIINNGNNGILLYSSSYSIVENNFISSSKIGIWLGYVNKSSIIGNNINSIKAYGIELYYSSSYNILSSNVLYKIGTYANNTYSGILIHGYNTPYSTHNIIEGNIIYSDATNKPKYGIYEVYITGSENDYNIITNNIISGVATAPILAQGPHTTVAGNKTSDSQEGLFQITAASGATQTALTVTQQGSGNIVDLKGEGLTSGKAISLTNKGTVYEG